MAPISKTVTFCSSEESNDVRGDRRVTGATVFESPRHRLVGSGEAMRSVLGLIARFAAADATVLICGPTGTGKELVARALHFNGPRREKPLVTVNCASLQPALLESELFGHEKGAFTGADRAKAGLFEVAEGGTLFIDEIGEMAVGLQAKLLRILEDGNYRRVGSIVERHSNVRVLAATNRRLDVEIEDGRFRADLYYRIGGLTITVPPLCERRTDIPELVEHLLSTRQHGLVPFRVDPDAMAAMVRYEWPGNVRELANGLARAQLLADKATISLDDLPESLLRKSIAMPRLAPIVPNLKLRAILQSHIREVLRQTCGNKLRAARLLGIHHRKLTHLIEKHGLLRELRVSI